MFFSGAGRQPISAPPFLILTNEVLAGKQQKDLLACWPYHFRSPGPRGPCHKGPSQGPKVSSEETMAATGMFLLNSALYLVLLLGN